MITYKPIVAPNSRRKDGTFPVKIRVTFKGVVRRLPTTLVCYQQDLTRTFKIKNATIVDKANILIKQMREVTDDFSPFDLESHDVDWVVQRIKDALAKESFHLDFFEWGDKYILCKGESTRKAYSLALNTLERYLGERKLDINDITRLMLLDFMEKVDNEKKIHYDYATGKRTEGKAEKIGKGASSRHIAKLQHIFNAAKDRFNDEDAGRIVIPRSPFDKIEKVFPVAQGQKNLGLELMQKIIKSQTDNRNVRVALDAFIVSFGLMGANLADLYHATPFNGQWIYNRKKTSTRRADLAEMRVDIPDEIRPFIQRLQGESDGWWLSELHRMGKDSNICTAKVNKYLKEWCESNGVEVFTFYAARHTWASLARNNAKIEKALVDECLCHKGDFSMADIYIERDFSLEQEANKKVLALLEW